MDPVIAESSSGQLKIYSFFVSLSVTSVLAVMVDGRGIKIKARAFPKWVCKKFHHSLVTIVGVDSYAGKFFTDSPSSSPAMQYKALQSMEPTVFLAQHTHGQLFCCFTYTQASTSSHSSSWVFWEGNARILAKIEVSQAHLELLNKTNVLIDDAFMMEILVEWDEINAAAWGSSLSSPSHYVQTPFPFKYKSTPQSTLSRYHHLYHLHVKSHSFNKPENWTKALKYTLLCNLKWALYWFVGNH
ncbi:hypothetical protein HID58_082726 [Brassica napus]|uniref:Uncharacterized protein n=1 Tax=Brassica napus TaxID=3708 RepID=A0ABQ7YEH9_BRANA|nr:hypothetical protein HID58_082726 [Brassica napus]